MQHVSYIISCFHCRVDELLTELKNDATINPLDYIVFFKSFKNMEIDIFLCDLEYLFNLETLMSNRGLDFMHIHTLKEHCVQQGHVHCIVKAPIVKGWPIQLGQTLMCTILPKINSTKMGFYTLGLKTLMLLIQQSMLSFKTKLNTYNSYDL
jgi:hypothetical protein